MAEFDPNLPFTMVQAGQQSPVRRAPWLNPTEEPDLTPEEQQQRLPVPQEEQERQDFERNRRETEPPPPREKAPRRPAAQFNPDQSFQVAQAGEPTEFNPDKAFSVMAQVVPPVPQETPSVPKPDPAAPTSPAQQSPGNIVGSFNRGRANLNADLATATFSAGRFTADVVADNIMRAKAVEALNPPTPGVAAGDREWQKIEGIWPALGHIFSNPEWTASKAIETLPSSAPPMLLAAGGGLVGGTAGAIPGVGLGSALVEYGNSYREYLQKKAQPVTREDWLKVLNNPALTNEAHWWAMKRAAAVGTADMLGAFFGGKFAAKTIEKAGGTVLSKIGGISGGIGISGLTEGVGEAGAQLATEGKVDWKEVVLESVIGGLVGGPIEVAAGYSHGTGSTSHQGRAPTPEELGNIAGGQGSGGPPLHFPDRVSYVEVPSPAKNVAPVEPAVFEEPRQAAGQPVDLLVSGQEERTFSGRVTMAEGYDKTGQPFSIISGIQSDVDPVSEPARQEIRATRDEVEGHVQAGLAAKERGSQAQARGDMAGAGLGFQEATEAVARADSTRENYAAQVAKWLAGLTGVPDAQATGRAIEGAIKWAQDNGHKQVALLPSVEEETRAPEFYNKYLPQAIRKWAKATGIAAGVRAIRDREGKLRRVPFFEVPPKVTTAILPGVKRTGGGVTIEGRPSHTIADVNELLRNPGDPMMRQAPWGFSFPFVQSLTREQYATLLHNIERDPAYGAWLENFHRGLHDEDTFPGPVPLDIKIGESVRPGSRNWRQQQRAANEQKLSDLRQRISWIAQELRGTDPTNTPYRMELRNELTRLREEYRHVGKVGPKAENIIGESDRPKRKFKSPWGGEEYEQPKWVHIRNLRTRIGQLARDLTDFNKRYPGEVAVERRRLVELRKELRDLLAEPPEAGEARRPKGPAGPRDITNIPESNIGSGVTTALEIEQEKMKYSFAALQDLAKLVKSMRIGIPIRMNAVYDPTGHTISLGRGGLAADGTGFITINAAKLQSQVDAYDRAAHEMGHVLFQFYYASAPEAMKSKIQAAFDKWKSENSNPTMSAKEFFLKRDSAVSNYYSRLDPNVQLRDLQGGMKYWLSMEEWMAEQTARWATSDQEALTAVDQIFTRIGRKILEVRAALFKRLGIDIKSQGGQFAPDVAMAAWLNSFATDAIPRVPEIAWEEQNRSRVQNQAHMDPDVPAAPRQPETTPVLEGIRKLFGGGKPPGGAKPAPLPKNFHSAAAYADKFARWNKWLLSLPQVAQRNPHIAEVQNVVQLLRWQEQDRTTVQDSAMDTQRAWRNLGRTRSDTLVDFMDAYDQMEYLSEAERAAGTERLPTQQELADMARQFKLDADQLGVFNSIIGDYTRTLALMENLEKFETRDITDPAERKIAVDAIGEKYVQMRSRPFIAHMHFGEYILTIYGVDGTLKYKEHFRTKKEAQRAQRFIQSQIPTEFYAGPKISDKFLSQATAAAQKAADSILQPGDHAEVEVVDKTSAPFRGLPNGLLDRIGNRLNLNEQQQNDLALMRFLYNPNQQFIRRFRSRETTPGYSMDFQRAHAQYFWNFGNYYARVKYSEEIDKNVRSLYRTATFMPGDNRVTRMEIANFMSDLHNELKDTRSDWTILRSIAFFWFIGGVPSTATLNLSQITMGTYPYLAQIYGDRKAVGSTLNAGRQFYKWWKLDPDSMPAGELSQALHEANVAGVIDGVLAHELAGIADGASLRRWAGGNEIQRGMHMVQEVMSYMFHTTEKINRVTTFVAAHKLAEQGIPRDYARSLRMKNQLLLQSLRDKGWTDKAAMQYIAAVDAVDTTQYLFSRWARPKLFRGKQGNLFIFKSFAQNTLFNLWTQPGLRTRYLLMAALLGGFMGLPGMEDVDEIIEVLANKLFGKDFNLRKKTREMVVEGLDGPGYLADLVLHGLSRYSYGIPAALDLVSGSINLPHVPFPVVDRSRARSLGKVSPVPVGELFGIEAEKDYGKAVAKAIERAGGVMVGMAMTDYMTLVNAQNESDDMKRWSRFLPRTFQNLSRAYRIYRDEGEKTRSGAVIAPFDARNPNFTPRWDSEHFYEVLAIAAGYQPTRVMREWDRIRMTQHSNMLWNLRRTGLLQQYATARRSRDEEDIKSVQMSIDKFNSDLPPSAEAKKITQETLRRSFEQRERTRRAQEDLGATQKMDQGTALSVRRLFENRAKGKVLEEKPVE